MNTDTLASARKALLLEKSYDEALTLLLPMAPSVEHKPLMEKRPIFELLGLAYERKNEFDTASQYFLATEDYYQAGYSQMLKGDLAQASVYWRNLLQDRPNHWCLTLHGLLTNTLKSRPTFFQIRNHIEADLYYLSLANQMGMVNNILRHAHFLGELNFETYKFIGRTLMYAGNLEMAGPFLLRGQRTLPNDPEIYYHLAQYYNALEQFEQAALMLHQCVLISPTYTPARELHETIHPTDCLL